MLAPASSPPSNQSIAKILWTSGLAAPAGGARRQPGSSAAPRQRAFFFLSFFLYLSNFYFDKIFFEKLPIVNGGNTPCFELSLNITEEEVEEKFFVVFFLLL